MGPILNLSHTLYSTQHAGTCPLRANTGGQMAVEVVGDDDVGSRRHAIGFALAARGSWLPLQLFLPVICPCDSGVGNVFACYTQGHAVT